MQRNYKISQAYTEKKRRAGRDQPVQVLLHKIVEVRNPMPAMVFPTILVKRYHLKQIISALILVRQIRLIFDVVDHQRFILRQFAKWIAGLKSPCLCLKVLTSTTKEKQMAKRISLTNSGWYKKSKLSVNSKYGSSSPPRKYHVCIK